LILQSAAFLDVNGPSPTNPSSASSVRLFDLWRVLTGTHIRRNHGLPVCVCAGTHKAMAAMKDSELGGKSGIQVGHGKGMARGGKGQKMERKKIS
jgi:hypothetical protein